jgi:NADPH:quinone reductase-like Zn-dependent oxidoreductase
MLFARLFCPIPTPGPGEILVRLRAATLNYLDIAVATGNFPVPAFPMIPVADGAGEVAAVGANVTAFKAGDRVIPHFMPRWQGGPISPSNVAAMRGISLPGSLAEYVVIPESGLVTLPSHLDFAQGAALPVAGTTAWNAVRSAQLRPGSTVVILGTGGVSIFALQFAKASGATVIATSSSDEKLERAKQLGADLLINYRSTPQWDDEVLRLTDGRGADLVVDTVGEATFARSLKAAAFGGTVFTGRVSHRRYRIDRSLLNHREGAQGRGQQYWFRCRSCRGRTCHHRTRHRAGSRSDLRLRRNEPCLFKACGGRPAFRQDRHRPLTGFLARW